MGLRTIRTVIEAEGRDKNKPFHLTEMPATQGQRWCIRFALALGRSGAAVPQDAFDAGWDTVAIVGLNKLLSMDYGDATTLLDELMQCVQFIPDTGLPRKLVETDIEEIQTRFTLQAEVVALHVGFSLGDAVSILRSMLAPPTSTSDTRTSPQPSGQ